MLGNTAASAVVSSFSREVGHNCPGHIGLSIEVDSYRFATKVLRWKAPKRHPVEEATQLTNEDQNLLGNWALGKHRGEIECARASGSAQQ
eukprot:14533547-Alexandrium_andersonii.AAC.1